MPLEFSVIIQCVSAREDYFIAINTSSLLVYFTYIENFKKNL